MKLSGAGKDAQKALRDAPLAVPVPGTSLRTQQGVGSIHHLHQRLCVCMYMRACVNSGCADIIVLQFLTVVTADSIEAIGEFEMEWVAPSLTIKTCVQGQVAADWSLMGLLLSNALHLSV